METIINPGGGSVDAAELAADPILIEAFVEDPPAYVNHGNTGAAEEINLAAGVAHRVVLDQNCTFTFVGAVADQYSAFTLIVQQDATGGRTSTFPANVDWPDGTVPTPSTTPNSVTIYTFFSVDGGTTYYGFMTGKGMG